MFLKKPMIPDESMKNSIKKGPILLATDFFMGINIMDTIFYKTMWFPGKDIKSIKYKY